MQGVYQRCCGLDIHKKIIVSCSITPEGKEIQSFDEIWVYIHDELQNSTAAQKTVADILDSVEKLCNLQSFLPRRQYKCVY